MSTELSTPPREFGQLVRAALRAPLRLQTYRNLLYLALMFPLGILYFNLIVVGSLAGLGLVVVLVGVPLLVLLVAILVWFARLERFLVGTFLGADVPRPSPVVEGSIWTRTKHLIVDVHTWKAIGYLLAEFAYGSVVFGILLSFVATMGSLLLAPFYYTRAPVVVYGPFPTGEFTLDVLFGWDTLLVGLTTTFQLGSWQLETLVGALLVSGAGLVLGLITVQLINSFAAVWREFATYMLTAPRYWNMPEW